MEFFDTLKQVKSNWDPYKKWDVEQRKKDAKLEVLRKNYNPTPKELEGAKQYGRTLVDVINTMDQHSIDKSEDAGVVAGNALFSVGLMSLGAGFGLGALVKHTKFAARHERLRPYWEFIGIIVTGSISSVFGNIWRANIMKQASRIARFQTRRDELKDSRNFVIYDEDQIKKAEQIAKTMPEVKEKRKDGFSKDTFDPIKSFKNASKTTKVLKNDNEKYEAWKKEYYREQVLKEEKFKTINPSKEDLSSAEKQRDAMLGTIRKIENSSLNYLNNMEMATYAMNVLVSSAGLLVGGGMATLLSKLIDKNKIPNFKGVAFLKGAFVMGMPVFASMAALSPINKLVKDAARIGRYKAKQEMLNNPKNFIYFDEDQLNSVKDVQTIKENPQSGNLFKRFRQDMMSLKQLKKDYLEYKNYMETTHKDELKLQEALKKVEVSDKQKTDAENFQKKAFHSFETMDEKAQRFTDDTDAAVDTTRHILKSIFSIATKLLPVYICGKEIERANGGKMPEKFWDAFSMVFSGKLRGKALLIMSIPFVLPQLIKFPIIIKGIQVKKDAGNIGVMNAMQDLNDPKNFLDDSQIQVSNSKLLQK